MRAFGPGSISSFLRATLDVAYAVLWAALVALLGSAAAALLWQPFLGRPGPESSPALREAAARRLAALAAEEVDGRQLVPAADPSTWWGTRSATRSVAPIRDPDRPVPISASMLESILVCPAQWFFEREAGGVSAVHQSANLGQVLHALAERVAVLRLEAVAERLNLPERLLEVVRGDGGEVLQLAVAALQLRREFFQLGLAPP